MLGENFPGRLSVYSGKVIFSQVMEFFPLHIFHQCVDRYDGNSKVKEFTCLDQFVAIMKKRLNIRASLYTILQVLSVSAFERTLLFQLLAKPDYKSEPDENDNQLMLFT